ncbi:MAG: hypothetical protein ACP5N2_06810 [Candidatus Nanoarchaeia archaeon]
MKKAQIQSGETVVVIIIVTIMIIVGLVFASRTKTTNITQEANALEEVNAMKVALVASSLNELKCSEYSAMVKSCIDYYRIIAFNNTVLANKQNSKEYYYSLLGNSKIDITIIYLDGDKEKITIYDYNNSANKSSSPVFIPSIVLNTLTKESYFSIMEVRTYS